MTVNTEEEAGKRLTKMSGEDYDDNDAKAEMS